jgi:hypothetical protein
MKKFNIILFLALIMGIQTFALNNEFKPNGKANVNIFSNFHSSFSDGKNANVFEITRAYLGYGYKFSKYISAKVTLDVGNPKVGALEMTAYLKNASLTYKQNGFTLNFGVISLLQFKTQTKIWGYRYIYKSFQDQYKYNSSADLGINIAYKFSDFISGDFSLTNGEGYKKIAADSSLRAGFGVTINPIKSLILRAYYDCIKKKSINQQSISLFLGYKIKNISIGAEYNKQLNHKNSDGKDLNGYSFYTTYTVNKKFKLFGRYDKLSSSNTLDKEWNLAKDGSLFIVGMEFTPVKGIKISPNYQGWSPKKTAKKYTSVFYVNLEIKF